MYKNNEFNEIMGTILESFLAEIIETNFEELIIIKEEKYKIVMDIPPKHPSFRKKKRVKGKWIWVVHKRGIIKWVDKKYGIKQHHRDWDEKVVGKKGPIGPWKCPG